MKLYTYYRSSAAYRVRIALNYKNIAHELIPINLLKGQQIEDNYAAINPQMRVPTLIDEKLTLGQSLAIMEYLEEKYPFPALLPQDITKRAQVRSFSHLIASDIHPLNNVSVLQYIKKNFHQDAEEVNVWYYTWLKKGFDALEALLIKEEKQSAEKGPFCFGEIPTMADICLIPQVYNAFRFGFSMDNYPKLLAIYEHCLTLEPFDKAKPERQNDAVI